MSSTAIVGWLAGTEGLCGRTDRRTPGAGRSMLWRVTRERKSDARVSGKREPESTRGRLRLTEAGPSYVRASRLPPTAHPRSLVLSVLALFLLFGLIQERAPQVTDLGGFEWAMIAVGGSVFVALQCIAAIVMLTLAEPDVTIRPTPPSINEGKDS